MKNTLLYRGALVIAGIILALATFEVCLRVAGHVAFVQQERRNTASSGDYTLLCVGESTTQGQYTQFLAEELQRRKPGIQFRVIDQGIGGTNTSLIREKFGENMDRFHPDMVIAMMGANDVGGYQSVWDTLSLWRRLKVAKLFRILGLHWSARFAEQHSESAQDVRLRTASLIPPDALPVLTDVDRAVLDIRVRYLYANQNDVAEHKLLALYRQFPSDGTVLSALAEVYRRHGDMEKTQYYIRSFISVPRPRDSSLMYFAEFLNTFGMFDIAEPFLRDIASRWPDCSRYHWLWWNRGVCSSYMGRPAEASRMFEQALSRAPDNVKTLVSTGEMYWRMHDLIAAERYFTRAVSIAPDDVFVNDMIGMFYLDTGRDEAARTYFNKTLGIRNERVNPLTGRNYLNIIATAHGRGALVVCMQYPMLPVDPLKRLLHFRDDVLFVDNESVFKDAVRHDGYDAVFRDRFGGSFGHCTERGNRLLAAHLADEIIKKFF